MPLFCFSNGRPLTRFRLLKHLRHQLQQASYHPHRFNTHSFRISGATSVVEAGASQATIQQLGRWCSQAYRCYIRPPKKKGPPLCKPKVTAGSPQAQAQEPTASHMAGASTNKIYAPQQDRNTGSSSQERTIHITLLCILRYWLLLSWVFPLMSKRFFPREPEGPSGP